MKTNLLASIFLLIFAIASSPMRADDASSLLPGSLPVLLGNQSVRSDLALTKSQCGRLDQIRAAYKADARLITSRNPESAVERKTANTTLSELNSSYNAKAAAVLTPRQKLRLEQIGHQTLGGWMLFQPHVRQKLGVSKSQESAIDKIRVEADAFAGKVNRAFENGEIDLQDRLQSLRDWRIKASDRLKGILTPDQKKSLIQMQGEQFKPA
jgi:hypothetical protein